MSGCYLYLQIVFKHQKRRSRNHLRQVNQFHPNVKHRQLQTNMIGSKPPVTTTTTTNNNKNNWKIPKFISCLVSWMEWDNIPVPRSRDFWRHSNISNCKPQSMVIHAPNTLAPRTLLLAYIRWNVWRCQCQSVLKSSTWCGVNELSEWVETFLGMPRITPSYSME